MESLVTLPKQSTSHLKAEFSDLPSELIIDILSQIKRKRDLLNVSLTCKAFSKLAEPFIYRQYRNVHVLSEWISFRPFLRRIISRPDLAAHIKLVELRSWTTRLRGPYEDEQMSQDDLSTFLVAAQQARLIENIVTPVVLNFPDSDDEWDDEEDDAQDDFEGMTFDERFCTALDLAIEDVQVVLLLSLLPNVEEIILRYLPWDHLPWDCLAGTTHGFQCLRRLSIKINPLASWQPARIAPVLCLPSLRVLEGSGFYRPNETDSSWSFPPRSLALTKIHLEICSIGILNLKSLLQGCKNLESFYYHTLGHPNEYITYARMSDTLQCQKPSLKHLSLTFNSASQDIFGSLAEFNHLASLQMEARMLFSLQPVIKASQPNITNLTQSLHDLLPASLEKLVLDISGWSSSDFYSRIGIHLPALSNAHLYHDLLPRLKTVVMFPPSSIPQSTIKKLQLSFRLAGVELSFTNNCLLTPENREMYKGWTYPLDGSPPRRIG
ncbi:hypothetical protein AOQ84DRAFT_385636 [Glonium stellatum]|uniref:F-box domain-containing protein n=1 Tax=Glonium stellatum TaxID=574774 RepID=A0A8E2JXF7_9PEZI|nr:hypothetical protein AOQ84DRAFT_385636 [Glonium stellatum]